MRDQHTQIETVYLDVGRSLLPMLLNQSNGSMRVEWRRAYEHFIKNDPEAVNIRVRRCIVSNALFGREISD